MLIAERELNFIGDFPATKETRESVEHVLRFFGKLAQSFLE
jgi:hypothetical protein